MQNDPHILVALASIGISHWVRLSDDDRNHVKAQDPSLVTGGIIDDHVTAIRPFPVLDAIASICVSSAKSEVIAVALQLNHDANEIRLTVAGNSAIERRTINHLVRVWALMVRLSNLNHKQRLAPQLEGKASLSTKHDRLAMVSLTYEFSINKIMKRLNRWWTPLKEFGDRFEPVKDEMDGTQPLKERFSNMVLSMEIAHETLQQLSIGQCIKLNEWDSLVKLMDGVVRDMKRIFQSSSVCDIWASRLKVPGEKPFRLRRAIEKLTTHHRHVQALISFADSPRLRLVFEYQLVPVCVPAQPAVRITLPSTPALWTTVLPRVMGDTVPVENDWLAKQSQQLTKEICGEAVLRDQVHCECSLIAYLESPAAVATPPFTYIGVSKLSCRACHNWLRSFNMRGGRQYRTHGCHGKWYWPWVMPPSTPIDVERRFADIVRQEYIQYMLSTGRLRSPSDISDASDGGAEPEVDQEAEKWLAEKLAERRAARTGAA